MSRQVLFLLSLIAAVGISSASAQSFDVNPYTGEPTSLESLSRELETVRAQTAVLEERVKQAQLSMTLNVVPARQRAELQALEMQAKAAAQASNPPPPPVQAQPIPPQETRPAPPPEPVVKLSGVIRSKDALTALLDVDGRTMVVQNGDQTQFGTVAIRDEETVQLGTRELRVDENTIPRLTLSDAGPGAVSLSSATSSRATVPPPLPAPGR